MDPWKTERDDLPLPARPQLKPWYRRVVCDDTFVLEHGQATVVFHGGAAQRLLPVLVPLLDGTRTTAQIVDEVGAAAEPAITRALQVFSDRHLLLDGDLDGTLEPASVRHAVEFIASIGRDVTLGAVLETVTTADVAVVGTGAAAEHIVGLLRQSGVGRAVRVGWDEQTEAITLAVVVPAAAEIPEVVRWNRTALDTGTVWLQVLPFDGLFAAIGPLYVPGETCCYECYRRRRAATSGYSATFDAIDGALLQAASPPALDAIVSGVAVLLATRWIALHDHYLPGVFYACEQSGTELTQHRVHRVPRCPACSGLRETAPPLPWFKEVGVE